MALRRPFETYDRTATPVLLLELRITQESGVAQWSGEMLGRHNEAIPLLAAVLCDLGVDFHWEFSKSMADQADIAQST
jgi:hypothetical protein